MRVYMLHQKKYDWIKLTPDAKHTSSAPLCLSPDFPPFGVAFAFAVDTPAFASTIVVVAVAVAVAVAATAVPAATAIVASFSVH
jgi:hypothetical protein